MRCAWLGGLLALAGCNSIFGLDPARTEPDAGLAGDAERDAESPSLTIHLVESRVRTLPGLDGFLTDTAPLAAHAVEVRFRNDDVVACDTDAEGVCVVPRPSGEDGAYRLVVRSPNGPPILAAQHTAASITLAHRVIGRPNAMRAGAATAVRFPPNGAAVQESFSTADWTDRRLAGLEQPWEGFALVDTAQYDRIFQLMYEPVQAAGTATAQRLVRITEDSDLVLVSGQTTDFTADVTRDQTALTCFAVAVDTGAARAELAAAIAGQGYTPTPTEWSVRGVPPGGVAPGAGYDVLQGSFPATDQTWSGNLHGVLMPSMSPLSVVNVAAARQLAAGPRLTAAIQTVAPATPCQSDAPTIRRAPMALTIRANGNNGVPSSPTDLGRPPVIAVAWDETTGNADADAYIVELLRLDSTTLVPEGVPTRVIDRSAVFDTGALIAARYVIRVTAVVGMPDARSGDLSRLALPYSVAIAVSNVFNLD